jgi:signal transduction histidine kinase/CheY-like chemotaxis protein
VILIAAPIGRDAELMADQLRAAGLRSEHFKDVKALCERIPFGVGAVIATEEALGREEMAILTRALADQPPWSDVPVIILTGAPAVGKPRSYDGFTRRTNVTLVDRPVRIKSLVSAVESALRARLRQYDLRDSMHQLEERIYERDRFLAVLGHELRNPLGAILLASQMTDADGKVDAEHAQLIERQSRHLTRLVNDLLDLSRVAAGKITLKQSVVDIRDVIAQSMAIVQPAATQQNVEINVHTPHKPVLIYADGVRVDQILTNVLSNAVKYTPEGGHVTVSVDDPRDGYAVVRIKDDGVGIDPERIDAIFELFAQAENAIGRAQGGMGIGLALVRNLVELHNGTVIARSDGPGKGSEFEVQLPLATPEQIAEHQSTEIAERSEMHPMSTRRIIIVEDNNDVRDLMHLKLRRLGHSVIDARDGEEGLRAVLDQKPDLALVDLGLPKIDGFELAKRARQELGDEVVLVAVSGFGQPEDKRRALEAGFDEHITKPADMKDLENLLRRFPPRNSRAQADV